MVVKLKSFFCASFFICILFFHGSMIFFIHLHIKLDLHVICHSPHSKCNSTLSFWMELCRFFANYELKKKMKKMKKSHWIFSVSCLSHCVSEWCHACRRLSLMETNVDTSHPRNCSQLTCCLIKAIFWFIYGRVKMIAKWVHAALTSPWGLPRISPNNCLIANAWRMIPDDPDSYILSKFHSRHAGWFNNHHT